VEEVKGIVGSALFLVLSYSAIAQEECSYSKTVARSQCGVVTDMNGAPIKGAKVAVMWADVGSSTETNSKGEWGFLSKGKRQGWILVDAHGFQALHFDYSTSKDSTEKCEQPIYIRLAPAGGSCSSIATLDPSKGLNTRK
jgi:hypothetical protein